MSQTWKKPEGWKTPQTKNNEPGDDDEIGDENQNLIYNDLGEPVNADIYLRPSFAVVVLTNSNEDIGTVGAANGGAIVGTESNGLLDLQECWNSRYSSIPGKSRKLAFAIIGNW